MPKITAYHPEIAVQMKDGSLIVIRPDLDDYYSDQEVLEMLQEATGAGTLGEAVAIMKERRVGDPSTSLVSCRVEAGDESYQLRHQWSDPL